MNAIFAFKSYFQTPIPISTPPFIFSSLHPNWLQTQSNLPLSYRKPHLPAMTPTGILAGLFLLLALYCGIDPFKHSAISEFPDFKAFKVDLADGSLVPAEKDKDNLLQRSEIKFLNQVQGPESIAFDPLGRGPYTGLADGRIVFWDGHKWIDFAYTSPNRSVFVEFLLNYVLRSS